MCAQRGETPAQRKCGMKTCFEISGEKQPRAAERGAAFQAAGD
jgi:hypothetical protein